MADPQFIQTDAGELVVLTRADYDQLINRRFINGDDDLAIFDNRMAELASGADTTLPSEVTAHMLNGDTLLKALRKWRGDTQAELALKAGLAQGYLSDLESGKKSGTTETVRHLAEALRIEPRWIEPMRP